MINSRTQYTGHKKVLLLEYVSIRESKPGNNSARQGDDFGNGHDQPTPIPGRTSYSAAQLDMGKEKNNS